MRQPLENYKNILLEANGACYRRGLLLEAYKLQRADLELIKQSTRGMNSQRMIHDAEKMIKELKERLEECDSELEMELYVLIGDRLDDKSASSASSSS